MNLSGEGFDLRRACGRCILHNHGNGVDGRFFFVSSAKFAVDNFLFFFYLSIIISYRAISKVIQYFFFFFFYE